MGIFDFIRSEDINDGLAEYGKTPGAVLVDVRMEDEYGGGRIPHSINVPLQSMRLMEERVPDKDTPLFVYCLSGRRSRKAAAILGRMGYSSVTDIGGLSGYRGPLEK